MSSANTGSTVTQAHSEKSKVDLVARETFATPQLVKGLKPELNKKELGKAFKQQAKVRRSREKIVGSQA